MFDHYLTEPVWDKEEIIYGRTSHEFAKNMQNGA